MKVLQLISMAVLALPAGPGIAGPSIRKCSPEGSPFVIWSARLGSALIPGELRVAENKVLVGTNNDQPLDPALRGDHGILACFDAATGRFLWQAAHARLPSRVNDIPGSAIGSRPWVDGDRVYYVSNRGELVCLDLEGFGDDENDGDAAEPKSRDLAADVVWTLDMVGSLGVFKRDALDVGNPTSSPVMIGDLVYCVTGNGALLRGGTPRPGSPSFLAADKTTGKVVWSSNAPGGGIVYGQWSSPAPAWLDKTYQVLFPGGDGRLYSFDARVGTLQWTVDLAGLSPAQKNASGIRPFPVAAPIVHQATAYLGLGRDLEMQTVSPLIAVGIDPAVNDSNRIRWTFQDPGFGSIIGSPVISGGLIFVVGVEGSLFALDLATGREAWHTRLDAGPGVIASPVVAGEKVYVPGEFRITVFRADRSAELLGFYEFDQAYPCTPVIAAGRLHLATQDRLWALRPWE